MKEKPGEFFSGCTVVHTRVSFEVRLEQDPDTKQPVYLWQASGPDLPETGWQRVSDYVIREWQLRLSGKPKMLSQYLASDYKYDKE
jgi:hypothetical protein